MFYKRFVQASIENDYDALPGIFHAAMVRIGDVMGQGLRHADTDSMPTGMRGTARRMVRG